MCKCTWRQQQTRQTQEQYTEHTRTNEGAKHIHLTETKDSQEQDDFKMEVMDKQKQDIKKQHKIPKNNNRCVLYWQCLYIMMYKQ